MRKLVFVLLVVAILLGVNAWGESDHEKIKKAQEVMFEEMVKLSNTISKTLPQLLDSETKLNSLHPGKWFFAYNYTLINYTSEQVNIDALKSDLGPALINQYCTDPTLKIYRDFRVKFIHSYHGKQGKYITRIEASNDKCKN